MKNVLEPRAVAHAWMNQTQPEARNSGNTIYFKNDTIFSYGSHFEIAKHVTNEKGDTAVLFTERRYSNTTAKHISYVNQATHGLIISVPDPANRPEQNFAAWLRDIEFDLKAMLNARKPEKYIDSINITRAKVEKYANFFGYDIPADLKAAFEVTTKDQYIEYASKAAEYAKQLEAKKAAELKAKHKKQLAKWRVFEGALNVYDGFSYLRYNSEKGEIETSQYIRIPVAEAKAFFMLIISKIKNGGCVNCGLFQNQYTIKSIDKKQIVIGCHVITMAEVNRIAKLLQWI